MRRLQLMLVCVAFSASAWAQMDHPSVANIRENNPNARGSTVLGSFTAGFSGTLPVGLEDRGDGNFLATEITNDDIGVMNNAGAVSNVFSVTDNPIGITTDGTNIYFTNSVTQEVIVTDQAGTQLSSFSVAAQTTFPEGVTFNPSTGNLYVVDGAGGNAVIEYTTAGAFVQSFPVNGSSQDGIAYFFGQYVIFDSGTDSIRVYDESFVEQASFTGTNAAGFGGGEGLAVQGSTVFVVAAGQNTVVAFDIGLRAVPTLGEWGMIFFMVALVSVGVMLSVRRRRQAPAAV